MGDYYNWTSTWLFVMVVYGIVAVFSETITFNILFFAFSTLGIFIMETIGYMVLN
jgi:hypothetical protein